MFEGHREPASRAASRVGDTGNRARPPTRKGAGSSPPPATLRGRAQSSGPRIQVSFVTRPACRRGQQGHRQEQMFLSLLTALVSQGWTDPLCPESNPFWLRARRRQVDGRWTQRISGCRESRSPGRGWGRGSHPPEARGPQLQALFQKQPGGEQPGAEHGSVSNALGAQAASEPPRRSVGGAGEQGSPQSSLGGPQPAEEA